MLENKNYTLAIGFTYIWIGFIAAISFMEAWLKFRAPNISIAQGLGIGRLVFNALNKMEWLFTILIAVNILGVGLKKGTWKHIAFFIPLIILIIQSIWLLPMLDDRAELYIQGNIPPHSNLHLFYIILETIKLVSLLIYGWILFNIQKTMYT